MNWLWQCFHYFADDVALRTEVKFCLQEKVNCIPTRDDVDLSDFQNLQLILVDHHVLQKQDISLLPKIVEIIDHRQQSSLAQFPPDCKVNLELVGSCATLIADKLLSEDYKVRFLTNLSRLADSGCFLNF